MKTKYKYKYLIFKKKPYNMGETFAQVNVSNLNKKQIDEKWNELEKTFPKDSFTGCLTSCRFFMDEFCKIPPEIPKIAYFQSFDPNI